MRARWLTATLVVAATLTGAVGPAERAALHLLLALAWLAAGAEQGQAVSGYARPWWALAAAGALGLVVLPASALAVLAPGVLARHPGAAWAPLSVDPAATVDALATLLLAASFGAAAWGPLSRLRLEALVAGAAAAAAAWALVGAAHGLLDAHALLGVIPVRQHDGPLLAPLINPNHHGTVLLLLWPAALVRLQRSGVGAAAAGLTLVWVAALPWLVSSMGLLFALGVQILALAWVAPLSRPVRLATVVSGVALAGAVGGRILAAQPAWWRLSAAPRLAQWSDAAALVAAFPAVGTGLGAYGAAYPPYRSFPTYAVYTHAHSDPLQALVEVGLPGVVALGAALRWAPRPAPGARAWPVGLGLLGVAAHACVDFPLHIPAVSLLTVGATVAWLTVGGPASYVPRPRWLLAAHAAAALWFAGRAGVGALAEHAATGDPTAIEGLEQVAPWRPEALTGRLRGATPTPASVREAAERASAWPDDADLHRVLGAAALAVGDLEVGERALARAAWLEPHDWRTWRLRARALAAAGQAQEAAEAWARAMRSWPPQGASSVEVMASAYAAFPLAVWWIDQLADAPAHWSARLAMVLLREGQPAAALLAAEQAGRLRPEAHELLLARQQALVDLGAYGVARSYARMWLDRRPDDVVGWLAAAVVDGVDREAVGPPFDEALATAGWMDLGNAAVRAEVEACARGARPACVVGDATVLREAWRARGVDPVACEAGRAAVLAAHPRLRFVPSGWRCAAGK